MPTPPVYNPEYVIDKLRVQMEKIYGYHKKANHPFLLDLNEILTIGMSGNQHRNATSDGFYNRIKAASDLDEETLRNRLLVAHRNAKDSLYACTDNADPRRVKLCEIVNAVNKNIHDTFQITVEIPDNEPLRGICLMLKSSYEEMLKSSNEEEIKGKQLAVHNKRTSKKASQNPFKEKTTIAQLEEKYNQTKTPYVLRPLIGEYFDQENHEAKALHVDFTKEGNAVIYGAPEKGKTTFICTLIYSLIKNHWPNEVELILFDPASSFLEAFAGAPQVKGVIGNENKEIVDMFNWLDGQYNERRKILDEYRDDALYENRSGFNRVSEEQKLSALVVAIHGLDQIIEENKGLDTVTIKRLMRDGRKYGIYFVVTALNPSAIKDYENHLSQIFALPMQNNNEYNTLFGSSGNSFEMLEIKDRGIFKKNNRKIFEFQTALVVEEGSSRYTFLCEKSKEMREKWSQTDISKPQSFINAALI